MPETDLLWMSLLVFLPAGFAAGLLLFPSRWVEAMRWWALFGTAGTLSVSLCVLVGYYNMLDRQQDRSGRPLHSVHTRLDARADQAASDAARDVPRYLADDWVARRPWIDRFDVDFALGVDGISLPLAVLTALVTFLAVVASWKIDRSVRGYLALVLLLETGVLGAFLALDFFLFYVFYEVMLLPMYVLIGLWGGGRRRYAALKFVLYTLLGSVGLLVALIGLYSANVRDFVDQDEVKTKATMLQKATPGLTAEEALTRVEVHTFDFVTLSKVGRAVMLVLNGQADRLAVKPKTTARDEPTGADGKQVQLLSPGVDRAAAIDRLRAQAVCTKEFQYLMFVLLFAGFAVKVPIVPLHSWLPDAHVEAPTPISMILAGVLLKLGGYGLIRVAFPVCPWAANELAWWVGLIGVIGIVYGAFVAMGQTDFKKLLAYSSVSHMGFVVLGLAAWSAGSGSKYWEWGVSGALFQMVAHGITASALFFIVGVVYDRAHHRDLNKFGGLYEPMPLYSGLSAVLFFASMGLPGLCGFFGEFTVFMAAWSYSPALAVPAVLSVILTAGYLLWAWQRVYFGTNPGTKTFPDLSPREAAVLIPFALLAIALGVWPNLVMSWMEPSVGGWVANMAALKP
ncbi:MAG: ndhD1 [Gemmataceae bacterium]|nr:ndhD1 [Gemmataceae bacterium]